MRLKYYLQGAGVGIIVTTIVLAIIFAITPRAASDQREDAPLRATESDDASLPAATSDQREDVPHLADSEDEETLTSHTLADNTDNGKESEDTAESVDQMEEDQGEPEISDTINENISEDDSLAEQVDEAQEPQEPEPVTETAPDTEDHIFTIRAGETSQTVSNHLESEGLVDDADDFNDYLCAQHIDNILQPGTYALQMGMDYASLARVLTKR